MSDDLRTRIAAAALRAYSGDTGTWQLSEGDILHRDWLKIADAVIRELGLRQERVELLTRYVTEWERDE